MPSRSRRVRLLSRRGRVATRGERGTSLLEVVVTMALLAGGVMASVGLLDGVANSTSAVDRRGRALELAESALEEMRSIPYAELGISPASPGFLTSFDGRSTVTLTTSGIQAESRITEGVTTYTIRRSVTWDSVRLTSGVLRTDAWKRLVVEVEFDALGRTVRLEGGLAPVAPGAACLNRSTDMSASPLTGIVNSYIAGVGVVAAGSSLLTVDGNYRAGGGAPIRSGDLVLVIQMTGWDNGNSGRYEYALATSEVSSGRLSVTGRGVSGGLLNAYGADGAFQVVRVPTYAAATTGAGLAALPFDGATGGVLAFDVTETLTVSGSLANDGTGLWVVGPVGVTPGPDRALPGGPRSTSPGVNQGGGVTFIRASSVVGSAQVTANGRGDAEGGFVAMTVERGDLAGVDLSARASGTGSRGGGVFANAATRSTEVSGTPAGQVDTGISAGALPGVPLGVGCLAALTTTVSTSTPMVPLTPGVSLGYQIVVSNAPGRGTAENVTISDFLPPGFGLKSTALVRTLGGATRGATVDPVPGTSTPAWSGFTIPAGGSVEIYLLADLPPLTLLRRIHNEATTTYTSEGWAWTSAFSGASSTLDDIVIVP